MKNRILTISLVVFAIFVLASCFSPWKEEEGAITIYLGGQSAPTARAGMAEYPPSDLVTKELSHRITFTGKDGERIEDITGETYATFWLRTGYWDIRVEASLARGVVFAHGEAQRVKISSGNNDPVLINMIEGPGAVDQGTGTLRNPFKVYDVATLKKVGSGIDGWNVSSYYEQVDDIDMKGQSFTPIAITREKSGSSFYFSGVYNGNGKTISNLTINYSGYDAGMFSVVGPSGIIKDLGIIDCTVSGDSQVGSIAGENMGTIEKCYTTGNINGIDSVGGIAGYNTGGTISDCYSSGNIVATMFQGSLLPYGGEYTGGIVGYNTGTVQGCYFTGSVQTKNYAAAGTGFCRHTGGIAGQNFNGTVKDCYTTSASIVKGENNVGGIVGYNRHETGSPDAVIQNCYATGFVSGNINVGGIAGENDNAGIIKNCVALNNSVLAIDPLGYSLGRVSGISLGSTGTLINNYGKSGMTIKYDMGGGEMPHPPSFGNNTKDGADIYNYGSVNYYSRAWWTTTTPTWNAWDTSIWDITDGRLPILIKAGGEQSYTLQ